ncbi:minichromosome maintenance protein MCM [Halorussus pelagicus]|uniref:minichromosome maintenance protein MCM n=1 Tax=Halorussus pelagicus TaxID=2505977 RepID=UPI000FFB6075|nr:minichromosome maintenance protein MCM [Halorussus pelagicus]
MARAENTELIDNFEQFYRRYYSDEIGRLAQNYPIDQRSLHIDWTDLYRYDSDLADDFLSQPEQLREYAEEALRLYDLPVDINLGQAHVRVENLDKTTDIHEIRSRHLHTLVAVEGTVERASGVQSQLQETAFECQRCGTLTYMVQGGEQEPHECQGCERQGRFQINYDRSEFVDAQTLVVKQRPADATTDDGVSIEVRIEDDLAGEVTAGDTVTATGVLHMLDSDGRMDATVPDKYLSGVSIRPRPDDSYSLEISDDDKKDIVELSQTDDIYERMVGSYAPRVYGYDQAKLAIILQLFSGVTKHLPDDSRIRGSIHVGLIGDPGTAKSRLLDYAGRLAPRTVSASGTGSSSVGLTASMERISGGQETWAVKAGTLPLADHGLARLDDLGKFSSDERKALESVLEEQTVEISKASVQKELQARAAVLAAANPKYGRFDQYEPIGEQVDLEPGLISQFDLLFTVTDQPDEQHDERLADHVLQANYAGELHTQRSEMSAPTITETEVEEAAEQVAPEIDPDLLRKHIAYARRNCFPTMTNEAKDTIEDFYVDLRTKGADEDAPVPVTARKLEALVRLSEASARVRLSDEVEKEDAERAVKITRSCLQDIGVDPETGQFDADVVETGTSKSERDRMKNLKQIIAEIEDNHQEGAPIEKVKERSHEIKIERESFEDEIDHLKHKGEVYEPSTDHLRTT